MKEWRKGKNLPEKKLDIVEFFRWERESAPDFDYYIQIISNDSKERNGKFPCFNMHPCKEVKPKIYKCIKCNLLIEDLEDEEKSQNPIYLD